jgi:glutathione S-transferase
MPYVAIVTVLALLEFFWFSVRVGKARAQFGVAAPATTGNDIFERHFRVHMNTQEQLVVFLPALWIFAHFISPIWAAGLGVVFLVGRLIYANAYVRDPKSRSLGFGMSILPSFILLAGILVWAVRALVLTGGAL